MKRLFLVLVVAAFLSSCSSVDPDIDFKGEIDDDFMTSLSRGEISMTLSPDDQKSYIFTKQYKNGKSYGNWKETNYPNDLGLEGPRPDIHIFDGSSWIVYEYFPHLHSDYMGEYYVSNAWREYKEISGYDKCQLRKCSFEYDSQNKRVMIDNTWYNIESATADKIVLSTDGFYHDEKNSEAVKYIYTYNRGKPYFDLGNVDTYESVLDIMLGQICRMKEYKGDIWYFNGRMDFINRTKLNLAKLEEALRAEKFRYDDLTEEEREEIFGDD